MPLMNGFEASAAILALPFKQGAAAVPYIVAVTANTSDSYRQICKDVGIRELLGKPLCSEQFKNILTKVHLI